MDVAVPALLVAVQADPAGSAVVPVVRPVAVPGEPPAVAAMVLARVARPVAVLVAVQEVAVVPAARVVSAVVPAEDRVVPVVLVVAVAPVVRRSRARASARNARSSTTWRPRRSVACGFRAATVARSGFRVARR
ncbi:MAG: hypothetical protein MUE31_11565 [Candidatus Nanopelagicales bacterium]|nr:hypothetical protein [Candidatus Nanopelagicales bacterium]